MKAIMSRLSVTAAGRSATDTRKESAVRGRYNQTAPSRVAQQQGMMMGTSGVSSQQISPRQTRSVHRAEIAQLETFIKNRSKQLDSEINALKDKIRASGRLSGSPNRSTSIENDSLRSSGKFKDLLVQGNAMGTVDLDPNVLMQRSKAAANALAKETETLQVRRPMIHVDEQKEYLISFLAKLRLSELNRR